MHYSHWTSEAFNELKTLWNEGLSASLIAMRLGNGLTRNAVLGKVHRSSPWTEGMMPQNYVPIWAQYYGTRRQTPEAPRHPRGALGGLSREQPNDVLLVAILIELRKLNQLCAARGEKSE